MREIVIGLIWILLGGILLVLSKRKDVREVMRGFGFKINRIVFFAGSMFCFAISLFLFTSTSFIIIDAEEVGHLNRIYLAKPMKPGQVIALEGQKGPQAKVLPPGFHFSPFIRVLNKIEFKPLVEVEAGFCGKLVALDGAPLREDQIFADEWPENKFLNMLDAEYFLRNGGQKGPQLSVIKPGKYRLNLYLFTIDPKQEVTTVDAGFVGVVKSNVQQVEEEEGAIERVTTGLNLVAQVVPRGYRGVWKEVLQPGQYYLNKDAFQIIPFDIRVQTWEYSGGYYRRWIDLEVGQDGKITQKTREADVPVPTDSADRAITVKVEGWEVPTDLRVLLQVTPDKAPYVVASVGNIQEIEDDVLTPTIRSVVRNVIGSKDREVFDLMEKRSELEDLIEKHIIPEGEKAWISIKEIRLGEPIIPPELLVARQREQLATQLKTTFGEERKAQEIRIDTEKKRAEADQQPTLIASQIKKQAAEFEKDAAKLLGEGEKMRLMEIANGQKSQADVLGQDKVFQLAMLKEILVTAKENPQIVKVPNILVQGTAGGFEGAAAILGASNITSGLLKESPTEEVSP